MRTYAHPGDGQHLIDVHDHLRAGSVIDRLEEEHHVIAEVNQDVDRALVQMVGDPESGLKQVQLVVDLLTDTMLSHLSHEERELVEPLARVGLTAF